MKTYKEVSEQIKQWKSSGLTKSEIVVNTANECIGWPYVYAGRGDECTPSKRGEHTNDDYPDVVNKCQVLNGSSSTCSGCKWHPGGTVLFYDCRGFTYWLFKQVGITINGKGATSQFNDDSNWSEKGEIANMPKNQVCCTFRYDSSTGKMEHTLMYDGNGNYIHCSGEVKKVPVTKYKATHYAIPKGMKDEHVEPDHDDDSSGDDTMTATVYAENGKPVKMRAKASKNCSTYWEIKCGTVVEVLKKGNDWTRISDGIHTGYMMTQFLKPKNEDNQEPIQNPELVEVVIPNITLAQAQEIMAQYPEAYMTVG